MPATNPQDSDALEMPATFRAQLDAALARPSLLAPSAVADVHAGAGFRPRAMDGEGGARRAPYVLDGDVAIVGIEGPLAQRAWACWCFEGDGYDAIEQRVRAALAEPAARAVVLRIDSPGGEVAGCFEAVRAIRAAATAAGKPLVAFADEFAASAAYALACAASEIFVPDSGAAGSVGVITIVGDRVAQNEARGLNLRVVRSGPQKAAPHPDEPLTEDAVARVQRDIDALAQIFAAEVAAVRPLDATEVLALEGAVFLGHEAVRIGLADAVGNLRAAVLRARRLADESGGRAAPQTTNATAPARAAAGPSHKDTTMKMLLIELGLSESASEAEALRVLRAKTSTVERLLAATGQADGSAAIGYVEALKTEAAKVPDLTKQLADIRQTQVVADVDAMLAGAKDEGKITPAEMPSLRAKGIEDSAWLKGHLAVKSRVLPAKDAQAREPAPGTGKSAGGKPWEQMKPAEKAALYQTDRAAYDALKAAAGK